MQKPTMLKINMQNSQFKYAAAKSSEAKYAKDILNMSHIKCVKARYAKANLNMLKLDMLKLDMQKLTKIC